MQHNGVKMKEMTYNGQKVKTWVHNAVAVFKSVVDTAITLLVSSKVINHDHYPYSLNAKIYTGVDTSLYKGLQFHVDSAVIGCNWSGHNTNLGVKAFPEGTTSGELEQNTAVHCGAVTIASAYRMQGASSDTRSSQTGKTVTLEFTQSEGIVDLWVQGTGTGTNTPTAGWALSNCILLAR